VVVSEDERGAGEVKSNVCYKCGTALTEDNKTREHIPPKCFVRKENYKKLIIVPSCRICNEGRHRDDEYFKNWLTAAIGSRNKEAKFIYENKTKKSWLYTPSIKIGMRNMLKKVEVVTPAGLHLGQQTLIYAEEKRGKPVIDSIAKGILWHHFGNKEVKIPFNIEPGVLEDPNPNEKFIGEIFALSKMVNLIENVFQYRYLLIDYGKEGWLYIVVIRFYNEKVFLISYLMENK
jgi:hypothetical protein